MCSPFVLLLAVVFLASSACAQPRGKKVIPNPNADVEPAVLARCIRDVRWRTLTNQLATAEALVWKRSAEYSAEYKRVTLERQSGNKNPDTTKERRLSKELEAARQAVAALKLRKLDLEASVKKVLPKR